MANRSFLRRWQLYRPSKAALFWSCAGCLAVTLVVGFTWGGWVTDDTATEMAERAAYQARAELAATICVRRFLDSPNTRAQLATLKGTPRWERDDFLVKGGWVTLPGLDRPIATAARLCAERLIEMELPTTGQGAERSKSRVAVH